MARSRLLLSLSAALLVSVACDPPSNETPTINILTSNWDLTVGAPKTLVLALSDADQTPLTVRVFECGLDASMDQCEPTPIAEQTYLASSLEERPGYDNEVSLELTVRDPRTTVLKIQVDDGFITSEFNQNISLSYKYQPVSISVNPRPNVVDGLVVTFALDPADEGIGDFGDFGDFVFLWQHAVTGTDLNQAVAIDGDSVTSREFRRGESWRLRAQVCPADGMEITDYDLCSEPAPSEISVTFENSVSTVIAPNLSPPNANGLSPLTCSVPSLPIDPDGDALTTRFDWFIDGQPIQAIVYSSDELGQTIAPIGSAVIQCSFTVDDGTDAVSQLSSELPVLTRHPIDDPASLLFQATHTFLREPFSPSGEWISAAVLNSLGVPQVTVAALLNEEPILSVSNSLVHFTTGPLNTDLTLNSGVRPQLNSVSGFSGANTRDLLISSPQSNGFYFLEEGYALKSATVNANDVDNATYYYSVDFPIGAGQTVGAQVNNAVSLPTFFASNGVDEVCRFTHDPSAILAEHAVSCDERYAVPKSTRQPLVLALSPEQGTVFAVSSPDVQQISLWHTASTQNSGVHHSAGLRVGRSLAFGQLDTSGQSGLLVSSLPNDASPARVDLIPSDMLFTNSSDFRTLGPAWLDNDSASEFGAQVTAIGDLTGDGLDEIAISAPLANGGSGAVYVFNSEAINLPQGELYTEDAALIIEGSHDAAHLHIAGPIPGVTGQLLLGEFASATGLSAVYHLNLSR